ncbi:substrate-binding periplasmic protein [Shewanella cutis]|uniref:ABC transporter substrate-binding protein n=1 Tax=Shewanella cutis TaxID=2766780 RepID=A0ABS9QUA0_9GAMM|nr:transporter substrate-binding domain-containing protein [Shewanella sp. PS-2]MCG9963940.1 ABC transporter substrate-binding protein [Shewanella sp. PS-2]
MRLAVLLNLLFCLVLNLFSVATADTLSPVQAKSVIRVGGYQFAPYVNLQTDGRYTGLTLDLINALNQIQQEISFEFVSTSIEHRYKAYAAGRFEMIMFESPLWGWQNLDTGFIPLHIHDGEVFIALKEKIKDSQFFTHLKQRTLALVKGYHYRFADFETDPTILEKNFNVIFVNSNKASIETVLRERAEIAPVTLSYINFYLASNPQDQLRLHISDQWDQHYYHGVLLNPHSRLNTKKLNFWLQQLQQNGKLTELVRQYGLELATQNPSEKNKAN